MLNRCTPKTRRPRSGFTLVELLVVVTIVAVLASLSLVITSRIRERARTTTALNSLRQVGIAHVAYSTEHNGSINTIGVVDGDTPVLEHSFWGRFQPYLFDGLTLTGGAADAQQMRLAMNALFQTADVRTMQGTAFAGIPEYLEAGLPVPLGFNDTLEPVDGQFARMASFGNPARLIYAAFGREFFDATHGAVYRPMPQNGGPTAPGIYYLESETAIICFLDGHVEAKKPPMPDPWFE